MNQSQEDLEAKAGIIFFPFLFSMYSVLSFLFFLIPIAVFSEYIIEVPIALSSLLLIIIINTFHFLRPSSQTEEVSHNLIDSEKTYLTQNAMTGVVASPSLMANVIIGPSVCIQNVLFYLKVRRETKNG